MIALTLAFSLIVLKPAAPKEITLLTGLEGSNDHELGMDLAASLEEEGLHVNVQSTSGGTENLHLLIAGADNTVALVPSSLEKVLSESKDTSQLVSLGSVTFQPLWLFYRNDLHIQRVSDLAGHKVALGHEKSAVGYASRFLLDINRIANQVESDTVLDQNPAAVSGALQKGDIDAVFAIGKSSSAYVSALLSDEGIAFLSFDRADAYRSLSESISKIRVPEGVFDIARNIPSRDMTLLTVTTNLVTIDTFNPAAVPVLLEAVSRVDSQHEAFEVDRSFPNAKNVTLPLAKAAIRYYNQGKKGLSKVLPYKVTRWLNHLGFVVLPLLTIVVVLLKILPLLLKVQASIKFNRFYKKLEMIDKFCASGADPLLIHREVDLLDKATADFSVPRSMREQYLNLRQLLYDLRDRLPKI